MTWAFKPNKETPVVSPNVPFFEDARADIAPYYSSEKTVEKSMSEATKELHKLGARVLAFVDGIFSINGQDRIGYEIQFTQGGMIGVIRIAGLPMRRRTKSKEAQVQVQALLVVKDWLKAAVTAQVFNPDMQPLLPFLLLPDGKTTVAELITSGAILALPEGEGR